MKKIRYIVPYFGKLPKNFQFWLLNCAKNSTINWLVFTDDKTKYNYPNNVEVNYCTFTDIKDRVQKNYDFDIVLDRPWKLCDYRVAFGEIFKEELRGFDFWGHCDIDLVWGDIRKFITDDILEKYEKIGFQGHSTLYKNTIEVNKRYRLEIEGITNYREIFTNLKGYCFDENIICDIYNYLGIPYFKEINFAHLSIRYFNWHISFINSNESYKNKRQVFLWNDGKLKRVYLHKDKLYQEEYMYLHFFTRPMTYKFKSYLAKNKYVFYPDIAIELAESLSIKYVKKHGRVNVFKYCLKMVWLKRKKINIRNIFKQIKLMAERSRSRR